MPFFPRATWPLWPFTSAASTLVQQATSPTYASATNAVYQAIQTGQTGSVLVWNSGLGPTTSGTGALNTIYWTDAEDAIVWEEDVNQAQYMALAQARVAYTEEQLRAIARAQEEHERLMAEERARQERAQAQSEERRIAALRRSRELLLQHLTPAQRKTFEENHWFIVQGGQSKKTYRIKTTGYTGNIEELRGDRVTHRLCGHLRGAYALHDHHVAQKISLEYDEETFVRLCNRHAA
jgi:hypothetical protein